MAPGMTQKGVIQPQINVEANHCKCSLHWKMLVAPFSEGDLNLPDAVPRMGSFTGCAAGPYQNMLARRPKSLYFSCQPSPYCCQKLQREKQNREVK